MKVENLPLLWKPLPFPEDWARQLQFFLENVVKKPVIAIAQGATLPVLLSLVKIQQKPNFLKGLIYAGPPSWEVITTPRSERSQKITWNLLSSPLGSAFYRYARRRQFLTSFSIKQLFGDAKDVDDEWLDTLEKGAVNRLRGSCQAIGTLAIDNRG